MKDLFTVAVAVLVSAVVTLGVLTFAGNKPSVIPNPLGGSAGPEHTEFQTFKSGFEDGGARVSIDPVDATLTLTYAQMVNAKIITHPASNTMPALTLTLPASTTFPLSGTPGASRTWVIENPFTAAATTTTIAAGTGVDLQEPDGQNVVLGINNYVFLNCVRGADSGAPQDVVCSVDETIPAD